MHFYGPVVAGGAIFPATPLWPTKEVSNRAHYSGSAAHTRQILCMPTVLGLPKWMDGWTEYWGTQ